MHVFYQHHNGGIDVTWVLDQPLAVEVVAVVGHQVSGGSEVSTRWVVQDSATLLTKDNMEM